MNKESRKYFFSILLMIVLTAAALWFTLKDDYQQVIGVLSSISPFNFMCITACSLVYYLFIAASLFVIAKEKYPNFKFRYALSNAYIGGFFSGITPSSSGGQVGQIYIFKKQGVDPSDSAGILWLDFVMYQIVMIFYTAVLLILRFTVFYDQMPALFMMILIGFMMNGLVLAMLFSMAFFPLQFEKICKFLISLLYKLHLIKNKEAMLKKCEDTLEAFTININKNRNNPKLILKLVLVDVLRLTAYYSVPFVIGYLVGTKMDFLDSLALSSYVSMANAFFPVPGASGGTEMMFFQLYSMILPSTAFVSTILILWRVVTFHLSLMIGGILFLVEKVKRGIRI